MDTRLNELFKLLRMEDLCSDECFHSRLRAILSDFPLTRELREVLLDLFHTNNDEEDE